MDLPATQAMEDEDFVQTQQFATDDRERDNSLVGILLISNNSNTQCQIFSGITSIGRLPTSKIMLNDETVSKRHAEIEAESADKPVFIKDLGSSNKTKINDTRLRANSSYQIKDNDKLSFGKITAIFKIHRTVDDTLISCTPQVYRRANAVIPDTPNSSMNNSSVLEGDVSSIPGTQADENNSCFRRPQIPVRTSISNEHESPKHVPFILDDVPSPLSNSKDKEIDISEVNTQRFTVNSTKVMTDNSINTVETQKVVTPRKSSACSDDNEDNKTMNNSTVKRVLLDEFENQPLEDVETQAFVSAKPDSSYRSENTSIYSAETQKILPDELNNQAMENVETQPFVSRKPSIDKSNLDVSIHSAVTQKIEATVSENELIENLDTQSFTCNSISSAKRKSANVSIYSAETHDTFDNNETQRFISNSNCIKVKSADVSIYSAATQKIESISESGAIENLETQKFEKTKVSLNSDSHELIRHEKIDSSLSFSIQDIDTMPFTKYELAIDEKSIDTEMQKADDMLLDYAANGTKSDSNNKDDDNKLDSSIENPVATSSKDKSQTGDEIEEKIVQNKKHINETASKSMSKSCLQSLSKFDKSKSMVESDNEEEIFSQNLIENSPFCLLLDDSKNDSKEQSNTGLQEDIDHENEKTIDSEWNISSNKADNSTDNKNSIQNKSTILESDDSKTDEEGVFSTHCFEEKEVKKLSKGTGNDSETDEEGAFLNHLIDEECEKSNSKPESDSETDEEGVFSSILSKNSKKVESNNSRKIVDESESEEEDISSNNLSKNKACKDFIDPDKNIAKTAKDTSISKSDEKVIPRSPTIECSLNKPIEVDQRESPIPESDDDIFNENDKKQITSSSNVDKTMDSIVNKNNLDPIPNSSISDIDNSGLCKTVNDDNEVDEMAPTQIIETNDVTLEPTQIVNTNRLSDLEERRSTEIDELAPTQLMETQNLPPSTEDAFSTPVLKVSRVIDPVKEVVKEYDEMDLAPTQKLVEIQECTESLAPTQKVVDTQLCSEEMGSLQFSESLVPTQIIETQTNDVEDEIATSPKISPNTPKRQLEEVEITDSKKLKTLEVSQKMIVDLNSTVEKNLNEMFEGSEEKVVDNEPLIETQQLENILESSQIEENSAAALNESINIPSPTLSNRRGIIRGKNRRKTLMLNKSLNATNKSVVNLDNTVEQNLNDLFDNNVDNVETTEPEPMLTQQLETILNSSQGSNPIESKEEGGRTLNVKKKSPLSLSMNLNRSMLQIQKEKEKHSSNVQSTKVIKTISQGSLNEKSPEKDYSANLADKKDNARSKELSRKNDKDIVYRRGTIGFTDDLNAVSTFDRVAFLDRYSSTDSQSDSDNVFKLRSPKTRGNKKCARLRLKSGNLNTSLSLSSSYQNVKKDKDKSAVLFAKKITTVHHQPAEKRYPVVRLSKLASPLYRKFVKPIMSRVLKCGTISFNNDLQPVESEELVSASSTESEDDLRTEVGESSPMITTKVVSDNNEQLSVDSAIENENNDSESTTSEEDFFKELPEVKIAGTTNYPATSSQLAVPSDRETDSESVNLEIPNRWKWYAEKRYDQLYEKCNVNKKKKYDSGSEDDEDEEIKKNNETVDSAIDDIEERSAAINKIVAQIGADKNAKKRKSSRGDQNDSYKENADKNVVGTRSQKLRKASTPSPKLTKDGGADRAKTNPTLSSNSDSESSEELSIIPKYRPVSPLRINMPKMTRKWEDEDDLDIEFKAPSLNHERMVNQAQARTSPLKTRRRRKSACNNDIKDLTQYENNTDKKKTGTSNIRTVDKDGLVFQVSRDSKPAATTATSRMSGLTGNRAKRNIDSVDHESIGEPSSKRTKTLANRQKLQVTVLISPLKDRLQQLHKTKPFNVDNELSNFEQANSTLDNKKVTRAMKTLDGFVTKTARNDSSQLSTVESSIVENKNESKNKPKTRGKAAARNQKAKVDTSSERSANSSKDNFEKSDDKKPKTRGRGRNQTTDSSVSEKGSSQDEAAASDLESKITRPTRRRLVVCKNQTKKEETKATKQQSQVIQDSNSEVPEDPKTVVKKNTRSRLAKTVYKSRSSKNDAADSKTDKVKDKNAESQQSSSSESVADRTTRTKKNKVNQELESNSSETPKTTTTKRSRKKPANDKPDLVVKVTEVDSNKETMAKSDEINDEQSKTEINVFKLMKKKMNPKPEEPTRAPAKRTRTQPIKNAMVIEETSSEESQEVSEIMKNSILENPKTATTRRRGRAIKSSTSYVENTESSDDVFEKPTVRPKRSRLTRADRNQSSQFSDAVKNSKLTPSSQKSTRSKHSPSSSPTPLSDATLTSSRLSLSPTKRLKVLFTGQNLEAHRSILKKLGGVETEKFNNFSVLITDKVRRTFKFLCSLARGIPIASIKWLDESKIANRFLDLEDYILNDPEAEAKYQFNLKESLDKARRHKFLEGYTVILAPKIKEPPIKELKDMVISSGGKPLLRAPAKWPEKCVVVTALEELDSAKKLIANAPKSVTIQSTEFILTGILRQDSNLNNFKLG